MQNITSLSVSSLVDMRPEAADALVPTGVSVSRDELITNIAQTGTSFYAEEGVLYMRDVLVDPEDDSEFGDWYRWDGTEWARVSFAEDAVLEARRKEVV